MTNSPTYKLIDPRPFHAADPDRFYMPSADELSQITPGCAVKVIMQSKNRADERIWLHVDRVVDAYVGGRLSNFPFGEIGVNFGDQVVAPIHHIIDIDFTTAGREFPRGVVIDWDKFPDKVKGVVRDYCASVCALFDVMRGFEEMANSEDEVLAEMGEALLQRTAAASPGLRPDRTPALDLLLFSNGVLRLLDEARQHRGSPNFAAGGEQ